MRGSAVADGAVRIRRAREDERFPLAAGSLAVFAHNDAAIGLYRKLGFAEEGRRVKRFRRQSGELRTRSRWGSCSDASAAALADELGQWRSAVALAGGRVPTSLARPSCPG